MARDVIIRAGWNALALCRPDGQRFDPIAALERMAAATAPQEWRVQALTGPAATPTRVPLRLIAMPLPTEKAEANRQRLKQRASRRQQTLDPRSLVAAGFVILVTSLPDSFPGGRERRRLSPPLALPPLALPPLALLALALLALALLALALLALALLATTDPAWRGAAASVHPGQAAEARHDLG